MARIEGKNGCRRCPEPAHVRRLFDLPHQHRFAALHRVNWRRALAANMVKTHREARQGGADTRAVGGGGRRGW